MTRPYTKDDAPVTVEQATDQINYGVTALSDLVADLRQQLTASQSRVLYLSKNVTSLRSTIADMTSNLADCGDLHLPKPPVVHEEGVADLETRKAVAKLLVREPGYGKAKVTAKALAVGNARQPRQDDMFKHRVPQSLYEQQISLNFSWRVKSAISHIKAGRFAIAVAILEGLLDHMEKTNNEK